MSFASVFVPRAGRIVEEAHRLAPDFLLRQRLNTDTLGVVSHIQHAAALFRESFFAR